jgi:hypothetical protein
VPDGNPAQASAMEGPAEPGRGPESVGDPAAPGLDPQPADQGHPEAADPHPVSCCDCEWCESEEQSQ